jgi:hypothetical protein
MWASPDGQELGVLKVTEQLALAMLTAERVHGFLSKSPGLSLEKVTVPVGVLLVPAAVSVTVAVQVVHWSTGTFLGSQSSDVAVERRATATTAVASLDWWVGFPA